MYSQGDEEKHILEIFCGFTGRALDIGAWTPNTFSNTRRLYELGWSLTLVEPSPGPFLILMLACSKCGNSSNRGYGDRAKNDRCDTCGEDNPLRYARDPRVTLINAAVAREKTILNMHATDDALSTACDSEVKRWGETGGYYGKFWSPTVTVPELVNQFGAFDFISIDCEGLSVEVFFSVPLREMVPKALVVEFSSLGERATMSNHAHACGYVDYFATGEDGGNLIFVSKEWIRTVKR